MNERSYLPRIDGQTMIQRIFSICKKNTGKRGKWSSLMSLSEARHGSCDILNTRRKHRESWESV
jgi:hypothetical protein